MNASPHKSFLSVGQIAAKAGATVADVERATKALGIAGPDLALNGVAYFSAGRAVRIQRAIERTQCSSPNQQR